MEFRHSVRLGALKANDGHEILRSRAVAERGLEFLLAVEHSGRCLDHVALLRDGRGLDDSAADIRRPARRGPPVAGMAPSAPRRMFVSPLAPAASRQTDRAIRPIARLGGVGAQTAAPDRVGHPHAATCRRAVRGSAGRFRRRHGNGSRPPFRSDRCGTAAASPRRARKIIPCERDPCCGRHRDQMDRVISGAAGRVQADDAVDERALVQHAADRGVLVAQRP